MGHLQLAHFVPNPYEDEGYWWFEEDEWGLNEDAQGLPTNDPEEPWVPTDWTDQMQTDFEELVGLFAGVDPEEDDEVAVPGQTEEEVFAQLHEEIFGCSPDLDGDDVLW